MAWLWLWLDLVYLLSTGPKRLVDDEATLTKDVKWFADTRTKQTQGSGMIWCTHLATQVLHVDIKIAIEGTCLL
jgi:hypothetical protein